jgi:hypothetical protein
MNQAVKILLDVKHSCYKQTISIKQNTEDYHLNCCV